MKQLLLSAYAAHIKVSPQIHDINESMLHNNLGHRLPAENTSSRFKQMEQPMKHKPPQLGLDQSSPKQLRICIDATAPLPWALLRLCPRKAEEGKWSPAQAPPCSTNWKHQSGPSEAGDCSRSSRIEWGSLGLLLLCAGWCLRATEPAEPSVPALGTAGAGSARLGVPRAESSPVGKGLALQHLQIYSLAKPGPQPHSFPSHQYYLDQKQC